jgi:hypothetical protein
MSRLLEQYLDLFLAFEPRFALNNRRGFWAKGASAGRESGTGVTGP